MTASIAVSLTAPGDRAISRSCGPIVTAHRFRGLDTMYSRSCSLDTTKKVQLIMVESRIAWCSFYNGDCMIAGRNERMSVRTNAELHASPTTACARLPARLTTHRLWHSARMGKVDGWMDGWIRSQDDPSSRAQSRHF